MTNKNALAILDELRRIPDMKVDSWTAKFLEDIDFEIRISKKNLSHKQGNKLMEIYGRVTERLCSKPSVPNLQV